MNSQVQNNKERHVFKEHIVEYKVRYFALDCSEVKVSKKNKKYSEKVQTLEKCTYNNKVKMLCYCQPLHAKLFKKCLFRCSGLAHSVVRL